MTRNRWVRTAIGFVAVAIGGCSSHAGAASDAGPGSGGGGEGNGRGDGGGNAGPDARPASGTVHRYVIASEALPRNDAEASDMALDLDDDGVLDNQLGMGLATWTSLGFTSAQPALDTEISRGTTITLGVLQTTDFTTATDAGFNIYPGADPSPTPCAGAGDSTCGHHLDGTGTFSLAAGARDPLLIGDIAGRELITPMGDRTSAMALPLAFGTATFTVELIGARVHVTGASAKGFTAILDGGIPQSQLDAKMYPGILASVNAQIAADCGARTSPPNCGCSGQGAAMIDLFDTDHDCAASLAEIEANDAFAHTFAPDIIIDGQHALSIGVKVTAVAATFAGP